MKNKTRFTFKRTEKLKSRKAIEQLFRDGKPFSIFPLRVLWKMNENSNSVALQCGFAVSSRHFKNAVERNRIKRLMREAYRLQKNVLHENLLKANKKMQVFVIYVGNELPAYEQVFEKTANALKRLQKNIDENS